MSYTTQSPPIPGGLLSLPRRAAGWLDDRGKPAWIAAMILGFVFVWPVGLAILAYAIWSKRMFNRSCRSSDARMGTRMGTRMDWGAHRVYHSSGNTAFDAYKAETLRRLEEEQAAFEGFLQRLREAKDKSEFDSFMEDRSRKARGEDTDAPRSET